ncbi:MAG: hypothetical protein ISR65_02670 [Bacteriovoracaceae bacterium]|nr:hypothetical protein [Bacteriovoracaceae bacterium]
MTRYNFITLLTIATFLINTSATALNITLDHNLSAKLEAGYLYQKSSKTSKFFLQRFYLGQNLFIDQQSKIKLGADLYADNYQSSSKQFKLIYGYYEKKLSSISKSKFRIGLLQTPWISWMDNFWGNQVISSSTLLQMQHTHSQVDTLPEKSEVGLSFEQWKNKFNYYLSVTNKLDALDPTFSFRMGYFPYVNEKSLSKNSILVYSRLSTNRQVESNIVGGVISTGYQDTFHLYFESMYFFLPKIHSSGIYLNVKLLDELYSFFRYVYNDDNLNLDSSNVFDMGFKYKLDKSTTLFLSLANRSAWSLFLTAKF